MKSKTEYINLLQSVKEELKERYSISSLRLFGSVARDEHIQSSDVDICVDTETPNPFIIMDIKEFLENILECSVDIVRFRPNMNPFLKQQIENEGIYI